MGGGGEEIGSCSTLYAFVSDSFGEHIQSVNKTLYTCVCITLFVVICFSDKKKNCTCKNFYNEAQENLIFFRYRRISL